MYNKDIQTATVTVTQFLIIVTTFTYDNRSLILFNISQITFPNDLQVIHLWIRCTYLNFVCCRKHIYNNGIAVLIKTFSLFCQFLICYEIIIFHLFVDHTFGSYLNNPVTNSLNKGMIVRRHEYIAFKPD